MKGKNLIAKILMMGLAIFLFVGCGKDNFVVTFDSANGTKNTQEVADGKQATKPAEPSREGYKFLGWYIGDVEYDFTKPIDKDVTITAKWEKNGSEEDIKTFTVSFNTDGGSNVGTQTIEENKTIVRPTNPTKEGYTFSYWKYDNKEYNFSSKVTEDITLLAVWTKKDETVNKPTTPDKPTTPTVTKYTVKFNSDGGSSVASQTIESGKTVSNPGNPTRNGYKFLGWTLNGNNYDFSKAVTGNIELIAKWEKVITYSKTVEKIDDFSPSMKVFIYRDSVNVTKEVGAVYTSAGVYLGRYDATHNAIIVDKDSVNSIGAIKINGALIKF